MRRTRTSRTRAVSAETATPQSTAIMTTIGLITTLILLWLIAQ
jgi:hypothetical protein